MRSLAGSIQDSRHGIQGTPVLPPLGRGGRGGRSAGATLPHSAFRSAFTLIEILVVVTIILVLTALVVTVYNANTGSDKVRSAARTAQSAVLGARDRALHAGARRGIRLVRDPQDTNLVTGFVYIQPIDNLQYGLNYGGLPIQIEYINPGSGLVPRLVRGTGADVDWDFLDQNNLLSYPHRVRIPVGSAGQWYVFQNVQVVPMSNPKQVTFELTADLASPDIAAPGAPPNNIAVQSASSNASCEIEVGFEILPNHAPITLPSGVVIDLKYSGRGDFGRGGQSLADELGVSPQAAMDAVFSPRGMITGPVAARGPIYLLLNDVQDATQNLNPTDPTNKGEKLVLAIFPQTGNVATFPIDPDPTDVDGDSRPDNLFRYAKIGSTSGQ
jgi:prepilin-type N-terminal cleavage/methylation domain-containing protein